VTPLTTFRCAPEWGGIARALFQLRLGVRPRQRRSHAGADEIAEFGDRNDHRQAELADLGGIDDRLQPFLRHLHAFAHFRIVEDRVTERYAAATLQQSRALRFRYGPLAEKIGSFLVLACLRDAEAVAVGRRVLTLWSGRHHRVADLANDARGRRIFQRRRPAHAVDPHRGAALCEGSHRLHPVEAGDTWRCDLGQQALIHFGCLDRLGTVG